MSFREIVYIQIVKGVLEFYYSVLYLTISVPGQSCYRHVNISLIVRLYVLNILNDHGCTGTIPSLIEDGQDLTSTFYILAATSVA